MIACLASALAIAAGEEDAWWLGLPVSDVQLSAGSGELPPESLEALLRTQQSADRGEPLDPQLVRLDLATLFQVGEFSAVEAQVEPWVAVGEDGASRAAVLLTYVVWPAPRIRTVRLEGHDQMRKAPLLEALGLARGQTFYTDVDATLAEQRLVDALHDAGYPDASATVESTTTPEGDVDIAAHVVEGQPNRVGRVVFAGDLGELNERRLRRWARKAGVREGEPLPPDALADAEQRIKSEIGKATPRRGWVEARVKAIATADPASSGQDEPQVTITVEPGQRLEIVQHGLPERGRRQIVSALPIDHRTRLTAGFLDRAPDRLEAALAERGWLAAEVTVDLEEPSERRQVLIVDVDRGPKHKMRHSRPLIGNREKFHFDFADTDLTRRESKKLAKELEVVLDQASPDRLRRELYTEEEMERALDAARLFLVDRGHLGANMTLEGVEVEPYQPWFTPPRIRVVPQVSVVRGPITTLAGIEVEGRVEGVRIPTLGQARRDLVGEPFSPGSINALAARVVTAHRDEGYIEADARVTHVEDAPGSRIAVIVVDPGPQVLLRSIVVSGAVHTRESFVQNIADDTFTLGEPVTTQQLDRLRDDLYSLGVFRGVSLDLTPKDEAARDLVVDLAERGRYELEAKFGASTDQGIRVSGRATRYHLWGIAHRLDLLGQIGFDWLTEDISSWVPDFTDPEWRLAARYTAPRFPLPRQDLVVDVVLREVENERTWQMDRTGGGVAVETRIGRTRYLRPLLVVRIGPRVELRRLEEVDTAVLLPGEPWADLVGLEEPILPSPWRVQDALVGRVDLDVRDDPIVPRSGGFVSSTVEWAPGLRWDPDLPRTAFVKGEARGSLYVPLQPLTLHLGVAGGWVKSTNDLLVPLEDRFRLGGTASLRGYLRDGVGPHNQAERVEVAWPSALGPAIEYTLADDPNRWAPTGGDTMASGILQLVIPFTALGLVGWDSTSASLFADAGNVWFLDPSATPTTDLPLYADLLPDIRVGLGAGFQMITPVGPLSVDFALNPQRIAATGAQLRLLRDDLEEPWGRVHITLGSPF